MDDPIVMMASYAGRFINAGPPRGAGTFAGTLGVYVRERGRAVDYHNVA